MTPRTLLLCGIAIIALNQPHPTAAAPERDFNLIHHEYDSDEPCDESFPLAPPTSDNTLGSNTHHHQRHLQHPRHRHRLLVAIPNDPTRRSYAPLCPDNRRIDIRHLQQCTAGNCWVGAYQDCFHSTSYECNADIPTVKPKPTARPTYPTVGTVHPVQLVLRNVPSGYRPSMEVKSSILRFVDEKLGGSLEEVGLELIKVEYAGRLKQNDDGNDNKNKEGNWIAQKGPRPDSDKYEEYITQNGERNLRGHHHRRLDAVSFPLRVTVSGPADISDFALSYIMENLRSKLNELGLYLRRNISLDANGQNIFQNVQLSADTFDFADILTGVTNAPTGVPTRRPTMSPTKVKQQEVVVKVVDDKDKESATKVLIMDMDDTNTSIPWWVWLLIVLVILLSCICCILGCIRYRRGNSDKQAKQEQAINIWMENSVAESKKRRQSERRSRPRNIAIRDSTHHSRRSSRPVRPTVKRVISQTELMEEELERYYQEDVATENSGPVVFIPDTNKTVGVISAISIDPPEENALVPYSQQRHLNVIQANVTEEPDGSKVQHKASMFADQVYYNSTKNMSNAVRKSNEGIDRSDGSSGISKNDELESRAEEPDGAKLPKKGSMYASEAMYKRDPRAVKKDPKKDALFVCPIDELPEEVRSKSRRHSQQTQKGDPPNLDYQHGKQRRKSSKKKKKRRISVDGLRSSMTRRRAPPPQSIGDGRPQDISFDGGGGDNASYADNTPRELTVHQDSTKEEPPRRSSDILDVSDRVKQHHSSTSSKKKKKRVSTRSSQHGTRSSRAENSVFSSFTRALSWKNDDIYREGGSNDNESISDEV